MRNDSAVLPDPGVRIGPRVRALREARGLSLRDLAHRCGVSAPMLSQVERGETSPTLSIAGRIAAGLGLSLSQLLRLDEGHHVGVLRRDERRQIHRDGHRWEELTPAVPGQRAALSQHTLHAGARTGGEQDPPLHEPGSRETVVVQKGRIVIEIDGERFDLRTGDTVTFDADLPHRFENPGRAEASFFAVVTAGLRTT